MALNSLLCADVPLSSYSLTHSLDASWSNFAFSMLPKCPLSMVQIR